ncbi:MAG: hypothetical protein O9295_00630 [Microcystis sp. LE18-22.4A]|nr:hypothetical protein [Microcystis sp. LE18-22.4A]
MLNSVFRRQETGDRRQETGDSFFLPTPYTPHPTPHFPTSPTIVKKCYNYAVMTAYHLDRRERQWL